MKLSDYNYVAFSGSRHGCPQGLLEAIAKQIRPDATILVGCARGVDAQVRAVYPDACVFRAGQFGGESYPEKLVARSCAMVSAVRDLHGCLIALPMKSCPPMVEPCEEWRYSGGSGTWGTIALAAGTGVPTVFWLPRGIAAPSWGDRVSEVSNGWFLVLPF